MADRTCISCKKKVVNDPGHTAFPCPKCTKYEIVRCRKCRASAIRYSCPACAFSGPN